MAGADLVPAIFSRTESTTCRPVHVFFTEKKALTRRQAVAQGGGQIIIDNHCPNCVSVILSFSDIIILSSTKRFSS